MTLELSATSSSNPLPLSARHERSLPRDYWRYYLGLAIEVIAASN